jgi:hypothetical protein
LRSADIKVVRERHHGEADHVVSHQLSVQMGLGILDEWQAASLKARPVGNASLDSSNDWIW